MDSNVLTRGIIPLRRIKRLRRCMNPSCRFVVGAGKMALESTNIGEFARLTCPKCGALHVFNPISTVRPDAERHIFVVRDRGGQVEHIFPRVQ